MEAPAAGGFEAFLKCLREPKDETLTGVDGDNQWQRMSISLKGYYLPANGYGGGRDVLATFCQERKRALLLHFPVSSHIRVCKMIISDWFNMDDVD